MMYCATSSIILVFVRWFRAGLNDDKWHEVVVVVDERSLRLSASVDHAQLKSTALLRRGCSTDHHTRPILVSLAGTP